MDETNSLNQAEATVTLNISADQIAGTIGAFPTSSPIVTPATSIVSDNLIAPAITPKPVKELIECKTKDCHAKLANTKEFIAHIAQVHSGRPCEYCQRPQEINKIATDYLQKARHAKEIGKPFIPYLQELADYLGCDSDRLSLWANKLQRNQPEDKPALEHPEFHGIIKSLTNIKELLLLKRTTGRYSPVGAIFQLKTKHGYIETEKQIVAGSAQEPLEIVITQERKGEVNE